MDACVAQNNEGNVALAFGIVTAAGMSTTLGAALAFVMPYKRDSKNLFLAACLSVAAGVMIYVSFVEIFVIKAITDFEKCAPANYAYLYATLCFFGGVLITYAFDMALHAFEHCFARRKAKLRQNQSELHQSPDSPVDASASPLPSSSPPLPSSPPPPEQSISSNATIVEPTNSISEQNLANHPSIIPNSNLTSKPSEDEFVQIDDAVGHDGQMVAEMYGTHDAKALIRMGIFAGIALAFHNFPEGLATFVAVLDNPQVGASVAIAIAIHNIPEGICVAMPIYYATGSRVKAYVWATLSGMTELVGAFLGWVVLRRVITPIVYGILFGLVAGMMTYISIKELLPTAHRYDPEDKVTTYFFFAGMLIMALSLVLFQF